MLNAIFSLIIVLFPAFALAQDTSTTKGNFLAIIAVLGVAGVIVALGVFLVLVWFGIWLWALLDVIERKFKGDEQTIWLIALIASLLIPFIPYVKFLSFATWAVPIVYLIIGRWRGKIRRKP